MTDLKVKTYSGYKADERPTNLIIDDKTLKVEKIIDQWRSPGCNCYKVLAENGKVYILKHDLVKDIWCVD